MLYISLILIASGILFILFTLISSTKKQTVKRNSFTSGTDTSSVLNGQLSNNKRDNKTENIAAASEDENKIEKIIISETDASFSEEEKTVESVELIMETDDKITEDQKEDEAFDEDISIITDVSLYEDASNIIDYENNDSILDPGLREYEKIKRIGEGSIELLKNGINFRTGKKLFRFDYHRVSDVKKGKNYFVLQMKGSNKNRIFVFKNTALSNRKFNKFYQPNSGNVK
ncbi:MAG: hypothetical protein JW864_15360 [Spirochaetes bacterium]|nr:hypothetical protein [Spirochaetota bacterium]